LAELLGRKPIFPGRDSFHQMTLIINVLGSPTLEQLKATPAATPAKNSSGLPVVPSSTPAVTDEYVAALPKKAKVPFRQLYPHASPLACDLLDKLLCFEPEKRLTVEQALAHPFLDELHCLLFDERVCLPDGSSAPVQSLVVGQRLQGQDGRVVVVESIELNDSFGAPLTTNAAYEVKVRGDAAPFRVTAEHPLTVSWRNIGAQGTVERKERGLAEITAQELAQRKGELWARSDNRHPVMARFSPMHASADKHATAAATALLKSNQLVQFSEGQYSYSAVDASSQRPSCFVMLPQQAQPLMRKLLQDVESDVALSIQQLEKAWTLLGTHGRGVSVSSQESLLQEQLDAGVTVIVVCGESTAKEARWSPEAACASVPGLVLQERLMVSPLEGRPSDSAVCHLFQYKGQEISVFPTSHPNDWSAYESLVLSLAAAHKRIYGGKIAVQGDSSLLAEACGIVAPFESVELLPQHQSYRFARMRVKAEHADEFTADPEAGRRFVLASGLLTHNCDDDEPSCVNFPYADFAWEYTKCSKDDLRFLIHQEIVRHYPEERFDPNSAAAIAMAAKHGLGPKAPSAAKDPLANFAGQMAGALPKGGKKTRRKSI
jgi:hypothetical protein